MLCVLCSMFYAVCSAFCVLSDIQHSSVFHLIFETLYWARCSFFLPSCSNLNLLVFLYTWSECKANNQRGKPTRINFASSGQPISSRKRRACGSLNYIGLRFSSIHDTTSFMFMLCLTSYRRTFSIFLHLSCICN